MSKGELTRTSILDTALGAASQLGLEGLSLGELSNRLGMSKSGLYAHFRSKEALQIAVLDSAAEYVGETLIGPALKAPRGLPRLWKLFENWLHWKESSYPGGCLFASSASEYDDRPGPVRDRLVLHMRNNLSVFERVAQSAIDEGVLSETCEVNRFAFDEWAILGGFEHYQRLLGSSDSEKFARSSFQDLIERNS